ncbi:50S ribosomal protein L24 [Candidatus Micrarchaeota archaeon]|nr:50S ribosomal protein L24 [Candidatus Micrarchaeota archaeon]
MLTSSKQRRKQRKARFTAPMHKRQRLVNVHISKELKQKLKTKRRSIGIRKGDKVKIMCGSKKGFIGKVAEVDLRSLKILVEGTTTRKAKGTEVLLPVDPSNLLLLDGDFEKNRKEILDRSGKV